MLRKLIIAAAVTGSCLTATVPAFAFSDGFLEGLAGITVYEVCYPGSVKADTFRFMLRMANAMTNAEKASVKNKVRELAKISGDFCPAMKAGGFDSIVNNLNSASRE